MSTASRPVGATHRQLASKSEERRVIFASSLGTVFEWYDFYLYGSLAGFITQHFFSGVNETTGYIFATAPRPVFPRPTK